METRKLSTLALFVGGSVLLCGGAVRADEVLQADLDTFPTGGVHAMVPQKVRLSPNKPAGVTREPAYRTKPSYGSIKIGDAKNNEIFLVVEPPASGGAPRLYVDGNEDGDLTNDPVIPLTKTVLPGLPSKAGARAANDDELRATKEVEAFGAVVPVTVRYNLTGRAGQVASSLKFTWVAGELYFNRGYGREGKLTLNGRTYPIALVDQGLDGRFDKLAHDEDEPPRVSLLIDKNNDGKFDLRREVFDAALPFRLGAGTYEVESINVRGTHLILKKSSKSVHGMVTAADLKVGGDVIDFDADRTDRKLAHFPDDYKGKVVLLDFWATWCPPCVEEAPNVVAVYNQFHKQGFDILGISLDKPHQEMTLASFTRQFGMSWPEVYDGGFWEAEIAKLYGIESIPNAFLVDGDTGKILAMGDTLRGEGLGREVAKALSRSRK